MSQTTDAIRFSQRGLLTLFDEDESRLDAMLAEILTNVPAWWLVYMGIVLEIQTSQEVVEAAGGVYGEHAFVHYWKRDNGGRLSLFSNTNPPTWNGGTFVHNFRLGSRIYNGFLFSASNY